MAGKKEEEEEEEKEIYYSITAEMILARPSSCSSQHTLSPTSARNAAAISEMSLMSAADRHDLFVTKPDD